MKQIAAIITASFFLFSCSESIDTVDKSLEVKTDDAQVQQNVVSSEAPNDTTLNMNVNSVDLNSASADVKSTPVINQSQSISLPDVNLSNPSLKPAVATAGKGLNPAHGQPNHRCDIAVGEPLSTPIKQTPVQNVAPVATQSAPQIINTPTPTIPKSSGPLSGKINPAHGEPGHDCAVQVGAPLP